MYELREGAIVVSDDPTLIDVDAVHAFLTSCYWSPGIPREIVVRAIANSVCLGAYLSEPGTRPRLIGFTRVITDKATYAYVCDVFVLEPFRGRGVSKLLMRATHGHPDLQNLRRWALMTRDAHGLYAQYGYTALPDPSRAMQRHDPDVYRRLAAGPLARTGP
jgi:GNAT superfamily N-acetyltransferase